MVYVLEAKGIGAIRLWKEHLVSDSCPWGSGAFVYALTTVEEMELQQGPNLQKNTMSYYRRRTVKAQGPLGPLYEKFDGDLDVTFYYDIKEWSLPRVLTPRGYVYSL